MLLTAAVVPAFAALHLFALFTMPLFLPWAALGLYASGATLFWRAISATRGCGLAACFQDSLPAAVMRAGPYRLIRHPFYVAYTLAWLAGLAATGWWALGLSVLFMALLYILAARKEERDFLRSPMRETYLTYMREAGGYLPRLRRR
jgi:protein-S-isoprenylcysteine O-methyltransferase Ste14